MAYKAGEPFKLSRTAIDEFIKNPRNFILKRKFGVPDPPTFPLTLNLATDNNLKNEFDSLRESQSSDHWLWEKYGMNVTAFKNDNMDRWRNNFKGVRFHHEPTNLIVFGSVDDLWENIETKELYVIDYKSTASPERKFVERWYYKPGYLGAQYRRQQEVYQWLLRKEGQTVNDIAYLLYVNGLKGDRTFFPDHLKQKELGHIEFEADLIALKCDDSWVEDTLFQIRETLESDRLPDPIEEKGATLDKYFYQRLEVERNFGLK